MWVENENNPLILGMGRKFKVFPPEYLLLFYQKRVTREHSDELNKEHLLKHDLVPLGRVVPVTRTADQIVTILRTRVNELGVAEPVIQQQGANASACSKCRKPKRSQ